VAAPRQAPVDKRRIILDAAVRVFAREGFHACRVSDIANEAGVAGNLIGAIQITDRFSLVEVPEDVAIQVIKALGKSTIRGKKVQVRRDKAA